jgi:hypothetical protein
VVGLSSFLPSHSTLICQYPGAICSHACRICLAMFEMADVHEQRINIKFCLKLGKTFTETHEMVENVYGEHYMSCTCCCEWFKKCKEGWQSTHVGARLGRPSTSCDYAHVAHVCELMHSDRCLTVWEIAEQ